MRAAVLSTVLELGGLISLGVGAWLLAPWVAFVAVGLVLLGLGVLAEPRRGGGDAE